ncbi:kinase-like domain-containing protein [Cristinia sonorae]|uniref:Kinase-like domain-containing protein n=1 Tax=Cristinia sonorae TaxID=1940300 RepID=A0A8K0UTA1_9AGAR|nr:kinase-like domain-containing protein [Cristinia sonorae]
MGVYADVKPYDSPGSSAVYAPDEVLWRQRYDYLLERGYQLRPRYDPRWKPSWLNTGKPRILCEDDVMSNDGHILDATRMNDKSRVSIKVISRKSSEHKISRHLSSEALSRNPNNHCVPVHDVFQDCINPEQVLLIMTYLRPFDDPPFAFVDEVMDFVRQSLEGLCFLHDQGVAHRDCFTANIMMDGRPLFPEDHHPVLTSQTPDVSRDATHLKRLQHPVKYYYVDFGLSTHFKDGEPPYVLGTKGADQSAPELSDETPYNAFMLDVYVLGHVYESDLLQVYPELRFLRPLVSAMMQRQPERRPTAEVALRMFHDIRRTSKEYADIGGRRAISPDPSPTKQVVNALSSTFQAWTGIKLT